MKLFLLLIFISSSPAYSSSCCGGGSSSSLIIVGDNRAEWGMSYSARSDLGQTNEHGWSSFNSNNVRDNSQSLNFQGQYQLSESWQAGGKFSFIDKTIKKAGVEEDSQGLGDIDFQATYEYMPEFTYHPYKPRGFVYSRLTFPTSHSLYDSNTLLFSDVRGTGLFGVGLGNFFIKQLNSWTLKLGTEWTHYFGKTYSQFKLDDYEKFVLPIGVAYAFTDSPYSIGMTETFSYQTGKTLRGNINSKSKQEYFWELSAFLNFSPGREEIYSLSYSDSTLIGKNVNSPLYRSLAVSYTYLLPL